MSTAAALKGLNEIRWSGEVDTLLKALEDVDARKLEKVIGSKVIEAAATRIRVEREKAKWKNVPNLRTAIRMVLEDNGGWMTNDQVAEILCEKQPGRWDHGSVCTTLSNHKGCMWEWKNRFDDEPWSEKVSQKVFRAKAKEKLVRPPVIG